jgi:organic hydroperoxide reductase OsmC/OhrA
MTPNEHGKLWVSRITLRPVIAFGEPVPTAAELDALHHEAHEECYIASSLRTEIVVERAGAPAAR